MKKTLSLAALFLTASVSASAQTQMFFFPGIGDVPFQKLDSADPLLENCKADAYHRYIKGENGDLSLVNCAAKIAIKINAPQSCETIRSIGKFYKVLLEINTNVPLASERDLDKALTINMRAETDFCRGVPLSKSPRP